MAKYQYDKLFVSCLEPKYFDPRDPRSLRRAVEHLRSLEQLQFTALTVEVAVVAGRYKLRAPASIRLQQIEGKTPAEVWEFLDRQVDEQIAYFEFNRGRGA